MSRLVAVHEYVNGREIRVPLRFTYNPESFAYTAKSTEPIHMGLGYDAGISENQGYGPPGS